MHLRSWKPTVDIIQHANITHFMSACGFQDVRSFHRWTITDNQAFWSRVMETLAIQLKTKPNQLCNLSRGIASPTWLPGAKMNIVDSCFGADAKSIAIIDHDSQKTYRITYGELNALSNQIANALIAHGLKQGDGIAIVMPMNRYAVAAYLGIIKMGGVVVSIADSFSSQEIATRLNIANTKAVFTQNTTQWAKKILTLYQKIVEAKAPFTIIVAEDHTAIKKRENDRVWHDFLKNASLQFNTIACDPMSTCNILFSSGTTSTPKAIPWNHTTPIKVASDAYFHQDIKPGDVLAWPTSLGWMMGPWLLFAAFMHHATLALYTNSPNEKAFGQFVQDAKVTMLGVVPTLVAHWHESKCMEGLDWHTIKVFSSTGECSNANDMAYLMSLGGGKPIIEYCGGTEIGGAYLSSTVVQENIPSLFSTPTMGMHIVIIDEKGQSTNEGELAIIPPSIGLSTTLLNQDHHQVYYEKMPRGPHGEILRRHGDAIKQFENGYYRLLGRMDDAMKLNGIKTNSAEIERTLAGLPNITELAAVAKSSPDGLSQLIIYIVSSENLDKEQTKKIMQDKINKELNPLFKIHDIVFIDALPRTASNKIIHRQLRER